MALMGSLIFSPSASVPMARSCRERTCSSHLNPWLSAELWGRSCWPQSSPWGCGGGGVMGGGGGSWYLFNSAELVYRALVVLHAVLSQVQVGRVLGRHKRCSHPCGGGRRSPCHHPGLSTLPAAGDPPGRAAITRSPGGLSTSCSAQTSPPAPCTLLSSFWYCGIFFSIWDRSLMVVCEGKGHGHSPLGI